MGDFPVSHLNTFAILVVAYLLVFLESFPLGLRNWIGAQINLLPVLMVYCGLTTSLTALTAAAVCGGLWFDALSANPLGISILPLFLVGLAVHHSRELILREQLFARFFMGAVASACVPLLTVLLLLGHGERPLIGWGSLYQLLVMAMGGGALTPFCFWLFDRINEIFAYKRPSEPHFRPDREIKRGRA
jgi:rod shape-determining protein MreD